MVQTSELQFVIVINSLVSFSTDSEYNAHLTKNFFSLELYSLFYFFYFKFSACRILDSICVLKLLHDISNWCCQKMLYMQGKTNKDK